MIGKFIDEDIETISSLNCWYKEAKDERFFSPLEKQPIAVVTYRNLSLVDFNQGLVVCSLPAGTTAGNVFKSSVLKNPQVITITKKKKKNFGNF